MARAVLPPPRDPTVLGTIRLMPHQEEAAWLVRRSMARWGGALLADPVGTGKTWVALAVAREYPGVIVVAPASLRTRWSTAFATAGSLGTFLSFESLSRGGVREVPGDALLVVDEAHHARTPSTRRFGELAALAWGRDILLLTATPVHNRARDLHALCSLFLGSAAEQLPAETIASLVCRRIDAAPSGLPQVAPLEWIRLSGDAGLVERLLELPPPVPPSDGGSAGALGAIALLRQWASSEGALLAALDRRLTIGIAMEARLTQGGTLTRADLRRWIVDTGTVQLGLPLDDPRLAQAAQVTLANVRVHLEALRGVRAHLHRRAPLDSERLQHLHRILDDNAGARIVLFSHSVDTARATWRAIAARYRSALLVGHETRVASGAVPRDDVVGQFAPGHGVASEAMRVDVLVATDVMSEGVDLHDAGVLVHLDLPWTMARLEQRVGRLRRLGATHGCIQQFAFDPPGGAHRLLRLLSRLAHKAGVAARLVGDDPMTLALPRHRPMHDRSPADGASLVRALVQGWVCAEFRSCTEATCVAVCRGHVTDPACLAVIDDGAGARLVLRRLHTITEDAHSIADHVERITTADAVLPTPAQRRALQLNIRALLAWSRARCEHLALLGPGDASTQRRVLRRLGALRGRPGRHARRVFAERLATIADVVLRSSGAGVERWLDAWLTDHPLDTIVPAHLDELHAALVSRARPVRTAATPQVVAAILCVPRT